MITELPSSSGQPLLLGRLKSVPADFIVREQLDFDFDEQGEHLYLYIRKCGLNTNDVQERLQKTFNCQSVDVGISGLKDKNAITEQWFSIRTPIELASTELPVLSSDSEDLSVLLEGEFGVLRWHRHSRKLRRGAHQFNDFCITLRDVKSVDDSISSAERLQAAVHDRLSILQIDGFANYFGPQRFGFGYQNLTKAERYFANPRRKMSRTQRSLLISSARSQLFNHVCAERVKEGTWNTPLMGEPMLLDGTHSFFINENAPAVAENSVERCQRHDIHPTGPLWGEGEPLAVGDCGQFETSILQFYTHFAAGLEKAGLKQQRRALRASVQELSWNWPEPEIVTLNFKLLKGVYATSFLSEFMINL